MANQVDFYGEEHTVEERNRVEWLIIDNHHKKPYDYLLCEELGPHAWLTPKEIRKAIKDQMWSISPRGLELALKLGIPAVGIDCWDDETFKHDIKDKNGMAIDFRHSFLMRETRMVKTVQEYRKKGRLAVMLGDSHLRTIKTKELGDESLVWLTFHKDRDVTIYRSPKKEIA